MFETIPVCQLQRPPWLAVLFFFPTRVCHHFMVFGYDTETYIFFRWQTMK